MQKRVIGKDSGSDIGGSDIERYRHKKEKNI